MLRTNTLLQRCFHTAVIAATCGLWLIILSTKVSAAQPNIVFIMADDLGYGDVQPFNPESKIPTPHINRLAEQGMAFTDAHSPSAVCTPTRYGVVTGRYCWRTRLKSGVLNGYGEPLIDPARETVASFLGKQGFHTGIVGKWHLGLGFVKKENGNFDWAQSLTSNPNTNGFEHSYVIPASLDFPPYVYIQNDRLTALPTEPQAATKFPAFLRKGERAPDLIMDECMHHLTAKAADYIHKHAGTDKPYFLYVPFSAPHKPVVPHPDFRGKSPLGVYADFVQQVDWCVGEVLKAIDDGPAADNTLVIMTSDNGSYMHRRKKGPDHVEQPSDQGYLPKNHRPNGPLRGTKADIWEAGHRVPFFARWPGKIKPGSKCNQTITHTGLFATCAEIIGAELPTDAAEDSHSWLPLLNGSDEATAGPVINHSGSGMFAIRDGDWKLVLGNGSGGRQAPKGKPFTKPYPLFNLATDLAEAHDAAAEHPEIVARLTKQCQEIIDAGRSRP